MRTDPTTMTLSLALLGLEARPLRIEAKLVEGPPQFELVGLPEANAREVRIRVWAALQQLGLELHEHALAITFHPPELARNSVLDLAVAVEVLVALCELPAEAASDAVLLGELSLDGELRPVRGVLPLLRGAAALGLRRAFVPRANAHEAALVAGIEVFAADHLSEVVNHLQEGDLLERVGEPPPLAPQSSSGGHDLADMRGQLGARRALEIAAAGEHPLLLIGPPGSAKTMLARRLPSILPPLSHEEALEVTSIWSVAGLLKPDSGLVAIRPFRAPHHTVSAAGLLGGGDPARPGEVSLAHLGVLFLDELHEFRRTNLDELHRVLDRGQAVIVRARQRVAFPAKALVVAAIHPCPCGFLGTARCSCSPEKITAYRERLTGPFFDRFDLRIVMPTVDVAQLPPEAKGEPSQVVQQRVVRARARRAEQEAGEVGAPSSLSRSPGAPKLDANGSKVLMEAVERLKLSEVECARVLRVAKTIAALEASDAVGAPHVAEAIHMSQPKAPR